MEEPADRRQTVLTLQAQVERAAGQHEIWVAREAELTEKVALAKGRASLKAEIAQGYEALQADAHESTVGVYSRLLTALVGEVVDSSKAVGLELSTERGNTGLDILAWTRSTPEYKTSVYEGSGGAFTDVVCMGLRAIATGRSNLRPLLVFDEPDKWISPLRVPQFYAVLNGLCSDLGFQALVISHFQTHNFGNPWITELRREGQDTASLSGGAPKDAWGDTSQAGLRRIGLRDFRTHPASEVRLGPGLNVICGDNEGGKSGIVKALRAALYGETGDDDIRFGQSACQVEIDIEDGIRLTFSRERKRNPVCMWRLTEVDGTLMDLDGKPLEDGGRDVPDWVATKLGIGKIDDVDLQIAHQKQSVFMLDKPASRRAAILSMGRESEWLQRMMVANREMIARDSATIRDGEKEIAGLRARIKAAPDFEALRATLASAQASIGVIESTERETKAAAEMAGRLRNGHERRDTIAGVLNLLQTLPEPPHDLPDPASPAQAANRLRQLYGTRLAASALLHATKELPGPPVLQEDRAAAEAAAALRQAKARLATLSRLAVIAGSLPDAPVLTESDAPQRAAALLRAKQARLASLRRLQEATSALPTAPDPTSIEEDPALTRHANRLRGLQAKVKQQQATLSAVQTDEQVMRQEIQRLREAVGETCPLCDGPLDALDRTIHAHVRKADGVAPVKSSQAWDLPSPASLAPAAPTPRAAPGFMAGRFKGYRPAS